MKFKRSIFLVMAVLLTMAMLAGCAPKAPAPQQGGAAQGGGDAAADYPKSPVTVIVPYAAGGGADLMSRALATKLQEQLGQPFVVSDKPGGSGGIGMAELARSKADGYTIILTSIGAATLTPNNADVGYSNKEFAPIAQIADIPLVLAVHKDSPYQTMADLMAAGDKEPGKLTYGSAGAGLIQNVSMEGMLMDINKRGLFTHVPFNGGSEAVSALLGKQTDFVVAIATEVIPQMKSGEFRALAVSSAERYELIPDVPTFNEQGYKLQVGTWYGFAAPAGTPEAVIAKLDGAIKTALDDPSVKETFTKLNQPTEYLDSKSFTEKWMADFDKNKAIVEALRK